MTSVLIPTAAQSIAGQEIPTVNARDLHSFLESKQQYADWIKGRIDEYNFNENDDFVCFIDLRSKKGRGGHNRTDYHITLDMAKELAMVERTEKGREARKYFIQIEKQFKETVKELPPPREPAFTLLPEPTLTPEQQRAVQVLITEKVYATGNKASYPQLFRATYSSLKDKFKVAKYDQVPQARFEELVAYINAHFALSTSKTVTREEFDRFVQQYEIRDKVMNEYLDDIWETGEGILSATRRLLNMKHVSESFAIAGSLIDAAETFFGKHSKLNYAIPGTEPRRQNRITS